MQTRELGRTGEKVSLICLGTMTWGEQNTEAEAHEQMDYAFGQGVTFFDAAEVYPVPPRAETQGRTETCIGDWFKKSGKRDQVFLATKVTGGMGGPGGMDYIRPGRVCLDRRDIAAAVDGSLKRLQTDRIDLYQIHWPGRRVNNFGKRGYVHDADENPVPLEETLAALGEIIKAGKVRYVGVSNETPWGVMRCLELSGMKDLPRIVSVQNPYNLLDRGYEVGLAEVSIRGQCGLLAYSPLAGGVLSGKYLDGARPAGARMTLFDRWKRYMVPNAEAATRRHVDIARQAGLEPAQMALAFVYSREFLTSSIIGATRVEQLKSNIAAAGITLSEDVLRAIEDVQNDIPNPCP